MIPKYAKYMFETMRSEVVTSTWIIAFLKSKKSCKNLKVKLLFDRQVITVAFFLDVYTIPFYSNRYQYRLTISDSPNQRGYLNDFKTILIGKSAEFWATGKSKRTTYLHKTAYNINKVFNFLLHFLLMGRLSTGW